MSAEPRLTQRVLLFVNALFHQALAVIVVYILWTIFRNYHADSYFTWHMALCSLGYMFFMIEAVYIFVGENIYVVGINRNTKITIHAILMGLGFLFSTFGILLMISHKKAGQHFITTHGKMGLTSWIFVMVTIIGGILAKYSASFVTIMRPEWIKLFHIIFGVLAIVFGLVTLAYGLEKVAFRRLSTSDTVMAATVMIRLLFFWSSFDAFKSIYNYIMTLRQ